MRLNWTLKRLALVPVLALLGAGCSGINTSHSISPATFFLPGLLQVTPPNGAPEGPVPTPAPVQQVAQAN